MGIFSVFAGLMHNVKFSVGLPFFESRWEDPDSAGLFTSKEGIDKYESIGQGHYLLSVDTLGHLVHE